MSYELPIYKKLPGRIDGPEVFERLCDLRYPFLLDTSMLVNGLGNHSFAGADPFLVMTSKGEKITLWERGELTTFRGSPMAVLKKLLGRFSMPPKNSVFPFNGGAVGFFSYDLGRLFEQIPSTALDDLQTPDLFLGFYDTIVAVNVINQQASLVSTGLPARGEEALRRARQRQEFFEELLIKDQPGRRHENTGPGDAGGSCGLQSNFNPENYCHMVQRAVDYIAAGDIFQVNLTQRFCAPQNIEPWELYLKIRKINPAPCSAFLNFDDFKVISASPERFLKVEQNVVQTCPIKGTRPRGRTPEQDALLRRELWHSEKDRAELMMIVDLERNDLGRVCEVGSVKVPELFRLEEYATVFHLVSTVEGRLPQGKDITDLLAASFPGGSITGAPKIRAMEIIEEMEPVRRGIYTGSIGYLGFDGRTDLNIVIRTILATGGNYYFQVGGGITADSDPRKEYIESLDKARALVRALGLEKEEYGF